MKTSAIAVILSALGFAGSVHAQAPMSEIRESTDPARVADVEQRAADLQARQQAARLEMTSGDSSGGGKGSNAGSSASGSGDNRKKEAGHAIPHSGHGGAHAPGHGPAGGQGGTSSR